MSSRMALLAGSVAMFLAVALGAFGAHALKARLTQDMSAVWQTAVHYHAWHALALLATGILLAQEPARGLLGIAGWLFIAGIVFFSGSLYLLALTGVRELGAVTPLGGVAWLAGWTVFAWAVFRPS